MNATTDAVRDLARPVARRHRLDLVEVVVKGSGSRSKVRVVVDRKGGVDLKTCRSVLRDVSAALDEDDRIADGCTLEVSSPGVDYPLRDAAAFRRVEGRTVDVAYHDDATGDSHQVQGVVRAVEDTAVELDVDGTELRVAYDAISRATQALPW